MPKFEIIQSERHAVTYVVEAESAEAAEQSFYDGTADVEIVSDDVLGTDLISVEEIGD